MCYFVAKFMINVTLIFITTQIPKSATTYVIQVFAMKVCFFDNDSVTKRKQWLLIAYLM